MEKIDKIINAIKICEDELRGQNRFAAVPVIIQSLNDMLQHANNVNLTKEKRIE